MMANILITKKIQQAQKLKLTECKNLEIEIQFAKPKHASTETKYRREKLLRGLRVSPCPQRCLYYIPSKPTTLNMLGPYSMWLTGAFQTNFSKQRGES